MSILQDIRPVSYLKSKSAEVLQQLNDTHRPIIITQNGEPKAVLQDPESYENMRNAIGLLKLLSLAEEEVRQGKTIEQEQVFQNIEMLLDLK
ncbi:MAG: type II toxin-antitoxin system Phd/YefM family antitoxin [Methylobacter sp.]|nr:MAG: type II toxin-antitoxin system Phd/YefM family antitoxin [Methylobacter sp.]